MTWRDLMVATRADVPRGMPPKSKVFSADAPLYVALDGKLHRITAVDFQDECIVLTAQTTN